MVNGRIKLENSKPIQIKEENFPIALNSRESLYKKNTLQNLEVLLYSQEPVMLLASNCKSNFVSLVTLHSKMQKISLLTLFEPFTTSYSYSMPKGTRNN